MPLRMDYLRHWMAPVLALGWGCAVTVPARPDQLTPGTFALALKGSVGVNRVETNETYDGTACRVGEYVLLLNPARKLTITVPTISEQETRYTLGGREDRATAHAFLNLPVEINRGMSLSILNGSTSVAGRSATEAVGSIDGQLAQEFIDKEAELQNASVHGVFRATKCKYSREDGYRAP
jgi:hypothetical protein